MKTTPAPSAVDASVARRYFLKFTAAGMLAGLGSSVARGAGDAEAGGSAAAAPRPFNSPYGGAQLNRLAYPLGGIGAGMICLEGTGALSQVSVRNRPDVFNMPCLFAAVAVTGPRPVARVLEGPVPGWKIFGARGTAWGAGGTSYGLPRFREAQFTARFPFGRVRLDDPDVPLAVELTGWSPFTPGDADSSSLPVAALEYRFTNPGAEAVNAVFSFNSRNFLASDNGQVPNAIQPLPRGFALWTGAPPAAPWDEAWFAAFTDDPATKVNHAWFRGGWHDSLTMAWHDIETGACFDRPPVADAPPAGGATLFVPFRLEPKASRTITVRLCWYAPRTNLRQAEQGEPNPPAAGPNEPAYTPWYAGRFADLGALARHWDEHAAALRGASERFADAFHATTLAPEAVEAVAANLAILKSPTVLRQADGRFWAWEGCGEESGCCSGSCSHVWNYAQALPHLFPALERTLRETEFGPNQDEHGHQQFRAALPIREIPNRFHAAADGQLGGLLKLHRDWRISGDTAWLRRLWPDARRSLDYCIATWDPGRKGWLEEPHHNTYDIEFWGPDGMCTSIYVAALQAAVLMGRALGDDVAGYDELRQKGLGRMRDELFDGEYFIQRVEWKNLRATGLQPALSIGAVDSPEGRALVEKEGPKYQYGSGCLSDGILGEWFARVCGVGPVLERAQAASHLAAVHRHNFKRDLSTHANPQRPAYAWNTEGGLLLCSWPKGGMPSLPFVYSNEVWTGIEYQVASHLCFMGLVEQGLEIVRACRARYDGRVRNPFDEVECGRWYARAMASYALLEGLGGARYDAVDKVLHLTPRVAGDFSCFLATATGYGVVGVKAGRPFLDVRSGAIEVRETKYTPCA